jgi:hypothetical protein
LQKWRSRWLTELPFNRSGMIHYQDRDKIPRHLCNEFENVIKGTEWIIHTKSVQISFWDHRNYDENLGFFDDGSGTYDYLRNLFPCLHDKGMLKVRILDEVKGGDHGRGKAYYVSIFMILNNT